MIAIALKVLTNKYVIIGIGVLIIGGLGRHIIKQAQEIKRQSSNYEILVGDAEDAKRTLVINKKELVKYIENNVQITRALRDSLKIKPKNVQGVVQSSSVTQIRFKTLLRDSVVTTHENVYDTVMVYKTFNYSDPWNEVKGIIQADTISLDIQSKDSLVIVEHWYKKGKWFGAKLFSKRHVKTDIVNSNPSASYHIQRVIQLD